MDYAALAAAEQPPPPVAPERIHALLLNGGGVPGGNYASHVAHLRALLSLLRRAGVAPERISILSSDGDNPAPDFVVEEPAPACSWLLDHTYEGRLLLDATRFESSAIPGFHLRPATLAELRRWFETEGARLRDGDTLLLYVTDHGGHSRLDVRDTQIVLWGDGAYVSVRALRDWVRALPRGVRVVTLMSQCFSGGFAWLGRDDHARLPVPNVCGYFSSRFDMPAYGCYTQLAGQEVGHSFAFFQALERAGRFDDAHRAALITDTTPDVPLRSSDLWLQDLLHEIAADAHVDVIDLIDTLLTEAWKHRAAWEDELRLIDRIAETYGLSSPRSVRETQEMMRPLFDMQAGIEDNAGNWRRAMASATRANLADFLDASPAWAPWLDDARLDAMPLPQRRALSEELLSTLSAFAAHREGDSISLWVIAARTSSVDGLTLRTKTRSSAALRMGALLSAIAGRVYLGAHAEPQLLDAYRALRACERLTLPGLGTPGASALPDALPAPLGPIEADQRAIEALIPPWTGLISSPLDDEEAEQLHVPRGAATVWGSMERSPAAAAGLGRGDVLLGPPDRPFSHRGDSLPWLMLLKPGEPQPVLVRRGSDTVTVTITPRARPTPWPSSPAR